MRIHKALILLLMPAIIVIGADKNAGKGASSPASPDVKAMLKEHDDAVQTIGNLLIKNDSIGPWLEAMKTTQQSLNTLAEKNGMRSFALNQLVDNIATCKQISSKEETPSQQQMHALSKQRNDLVKQLIDTKSNDINALINLDGKIDKAENKWLHSMMQSDKNPKKPKVSDDYKNIVRKLKAYDEIIMAAALPDFNLDPAVAQLLASDKAAPAVAVLLKYSSFSDDCDIPNFGIFRRIANDSYGDIINAMVTFYNLAQKLKSFEQKMKNAQESPKS